MTGPGSDTATPPIPMLTFTDADHGYRGIIEGPGRELASAFEAARSVTNIDLNAADMTCAVLLRLKAFLHCQDQIKTHLGKVYAAPAADFFVETVCFFLRVALDKLDPSLTVKSEKSIVRRRGAMRPDISVWRGDKVVAAIECKTQLGWNRTGWLQDFTKREERLKEVFPEARLFLLVMTANNWSGFGNDSRAGSQFFVLLNEIWPNHFDASNSQRYIVHTLEGLINQLLT